MVQVRPTTRVFPRALSSTAVIRRRPLTLIEASEDNADDDGESVRVSFGTLPDQVSAGTYSGTTVSITDDDVPSQSPSALRRSPTPSPRATASR